MHEHFDADGNLTGTTVITRESEWDDETRERVLALAAHEDLICRCGCGLPMSQSHQKSPFLVDTYTCYAGRAVARRKREDEEKAKADPNSFPEGWSDGVHYFVKPHKEDSRAR